MSQMSLVFAVFVIFTFLTMSGKFSIATSAMFCAISLFATGILTFGEAFAGFSNSSVIMMGSMFIVAAGLSKTSLLTRLSRSIIKPNSSDTAIMAGFAFMVILLGSFVNGVATCTIMLPIVQTVCRDQKRPISKFIQPVCALAIVWAGLLPLGGSAGSYLGTNTIIETLGGVGTMTFFSAMVCKLPIGIALTLYAIFFGHRVAPDNGLAEVNEAAVEKAQKMQKGSELSPAKEKLASAIFAAVIVGIVFCALTKRDVTIPTCIGALLTVMCGIVTPKEVPGKIQLPILLIFVGTLPLATALAKTGGDVVIADAVKGILGNTSSPYIIGGLIFLSCTVLTQFMSNSAVGGAFKTLAILLAVQCGFDARIGFFSSQLGSNNCFCTPMASPTQTIAFGEGNYTMKQYFLCGLPYVIIYFVVYILWVPFICMR